METLINAGYIAASILFILGLKKLGRQETARNGNRMSACGMLIAIGVTLLEKEVISYGWILAAAALGGLIGLVSARRVQMTAMPEMVALFNGSGGMASLLVGWYEYQNNPQLMTFTSAAVYLTVLIGGVTFTGSLVAWGKLAERLPSKPVLFKAQQIVNGLLLALLLAGAVAFTRNPADSQTIFFAMVVLTLIFGVFMVIPIGGADMPVVIALLNSYSGLAASAAGFVISNNVLIVAGSLVGASGLILTSIMCKAMNRSLANVLFSGFGSAASSGSGSPYQGEANPISAEDAFLILEAASSVVFVPGYGMAVAQAQHAVRELGELLEANGTEVQYAIHPVAGRMPGHMNVLLAEASVSYDLLVEPIDVNPTMSTVDAAVVIGANDVVNPAARDDAHSPLYGMPIIEVDQARTCIVLKRSLSSGFAGIENPLFFAKNTRMLFGDAKTTVSALVAEFKGD